MLQRIGRKKYKHYALDFETHNDEETIKLRKTSIWLCSFIDENSKIDDEESYLYTMEQVVNRMEEISNPKATHKQGRPIKNCCIWIFNLSFEWSFILPYLESIGFQFKEHIEDEDEKVFNSISTRSCSSVWQVQLKFTKKGGLVLLKDLSKIFSGSLRNVAKSFNLPTQKGDIDYRLNRLHGHVVTKEEKEYCFKDTRIIVDILLIMQARNDKNFFSSASMATYSMKNLVKYGWPRSCKPYIKYREEYPELDQEESEFLRRGVEGGITYAPTRWQFKDINQQIYHVDFHSMHPSSAYFNLFPYGKGIYFKGEPCLGYTCACRIRISYDDVILHSVIKLIGQRCVEGYELVVWDFEIPTMRKCYVNLQVEYIDGYAYKTKPLPWRKYYSYCYNQRLIAKQNHDEFNKLFYKLLINSSYGKHLEKPHNEIFINTTKTLDKIITSVVEEKPVEKQQVNAHYTYLPVGSAIPARSRVKLIETALFISPTGKEICYFDTDSIFFIATEETLRNWNNPKIDKKDFLGGIALEEIIDRAQFTAPKRYKTLVEGKLSVKSGGINFDKYLEATGQKALEDVPFDEINIVSSKWLVQRAYRVEGGTIIEFQEKEMKVAPKYLTTYEENV